jgi:hypothetical protein
MSGSLTNNPSERLLPAGEGESRFYSDTPDHLHSDLKMTSGGYAGVVPSSSSAPATQSKQAREGKPPSKAAFEWPLALALCAATFGTAIGWTGVLSGLVYYSKFYGPASFLYLNTAVYGWHLRLSSPLLLSCLTPSLCFAAVVQVQAPFFQCCKAGTTPNSTHNTAHAPPPPFDWCSRTP